MTTWMRKVFVSEGATEYPPGPHLDRLRQKFQRGAAVVLCLDVSGSMSADLPQAVRGSEKFLHEAVAGGYSVGLILWHSRVGASTELSRNPEAALNTLRRARVKGGTDLLPALREAARRLEGSEAEDRVIAVFGDGDLGVHAAMTGRFAAHLKTQGIRIITMGLGHASATALSRIASETVDDEVMVASRETLVENISSMSRGLRRRKQG